MEEDNLQRFSRSGAGSGIGIIYKDAQRDYNQVRWATNEISSSALNPLAAHVDTSAGGPDSCVRVQSLAWQRSGLATVKVQMPSATAGPLSVVDTRDASCPRRFLPATMQPTHMAYW